MSGSRIDNARRIIVKDTLYRATATYPTNMANWKTSTEAVVTPTANSACAIRTAKVSLFMCILH
jgi:hypothetical protein